LENPQVLKLNPNPTFKVDIELPTTDGKMSFKGVFKYLTRKAWSEKVAAFGDATTIKDVLMDVMVGWEDVDEPFSAEAVEKLSDTHHNAMAVIYQRFIEGLTQGKLGN
jgi:hypothetical protein